MSQEYTSMKKGMLILGTVLLFIGIILTIYGLMIFGSFGESNDMIFKEGFSWFILSGIGALLLFCGIILIYLSQFRRVTKYFATEGSPAITQASKALGKGIKEAEIASSKPTEVIKVKCPHCGYFDSKDAEFCSKCGKKL